MRLALSLLVGVTALSLVACGGSDDEAAVPLPVEQRFVTVEDAPESKADPVETRETTEDFDAFVASLSERSVDPDVQELTEVFEEAGFVGAGVDTRYYGETHTPGESPHVVSSFVELESADGAASALDWLEADVSKPCPMSCAADREAFDVDLEGARGVHAIATAEDIAALGNADEVPFESFWVGFTDGALVYTVDLYGRPGAVTEQQALEIASAYHERITGG